MIEHLRSVLAPRMRPDFLIIGAQKAGTTALFGMLAAHQAVLAPAVKEHHFFDEDERYAKGMTSYLRGFPRRNRSRGQVTFEATPSYLFIEAAAKRIHDQLPGVKLIAVLRNPVSRAYSAWNMFRDFKNDPVHGHLHDTRSFEQAVEEELGGKDLPMAHRYLARGLYADQIKRYFDMFGRDRLLLLGHEHLLRSPEEVMKKCCEFLELPAFAGGADELNRQENVRPYRSRLDPVLRQRLDEFFAPDREKLKGVLGPDVDVRDLLG